MEKDSVLEMRHIYKTFPGVKALQNVDFTLKKGEIHALMGENGAGKSTLIKMIAGLIQPDSVRLRWVKPSRSDIWHRKSRIWIRTSG